MTVQEKVKLLLPKLEILKNAPKSSDNKRWCFSLLHDALVFSGDRLDNIDPMSFVAFIELTSHSVSDPNPNPKAVHNDLVRLGFWIREMN